ncbi:MAG: hypothetical protein L6Q83_01980 [Gammaproteobacteria bacterium]|nr:hypothetical protein [Gammaproteobacteria bacterium]
MNTETIQGARTNAGNPAEPPKIFSDQAAQSTDKAIRSTQRVANEALTGLANTAQDMRDEAAPLLNRAAVEAHTLTQRGLAAVRNGSHQLQDRTRRASASTAAYVRDRPVTAMLIAGATGAAVMSMINLVRRSRGPG